MIDDNVYIYIDESDDLGKSSSRYFIIAALITTNPKPISNIIKHIRERKLKKKLRELCELKANNSNAIIRKAVLNSLIKTSCEFHIITVDKSKVRDYLFEKKDKLYNYIAGILFEHSQKPAKKYHIIIDKKDKKDLLREDLTNYLSKIKAPWNTKVTVQHIESHTDKVLQAVDFVAWSTHRKYNYGEEEYFKIIEPKIKHITNLFS